MHDYRAGQKTDKPACTHSGECMARGALVPVSVLQKTCPATQDTVSAIFFWTTILFMV
jgi:hypothetical protein